MKPLRTGDRIRLTTANSVPGFESGAKGTIVGGPIVRAGRPSYYLVAMEEGGEATTTILDAEEIELDA